ncbi:tRNA (Adenine(58)-N(1))-methyltransferase non-catalytic subunit trm6 [Pleurostoma richardsiae]|uniref:tRNA (adenine(58)-N(1))-methyltransferase non-catalytic subunit TRM6 n=1 Tax=Pleurostoma richardsiae TaxID=41990 RepID=A0AA38VKY9_9PEZI|nr:tRNA (Adenine(58)-N(1))-methyltransferase non-catalytic subunit trm6 [Pleurostoma richardsiae]
MHSLIQPHVWVALKLPSGNTRVLQVTPNTTISLGKYGSFSSNLILQRPYHVTYELLDKRPDENFSRLRIVPTDELYADIFAEEAGITSSPTSRQDSLAAADESDKIITPTDGVEYSLVDEITGSVVARSNREIIDDNARQTLTYDEIEALKRDGTDAGKEIIAKLMLSHTGLDQKTSYSLAKYKILKTKKYIRRFSVLPLDVVTFAGWFLHEKEGQRILEMRDEMLGLLGCWGNVHCGGLDKFRGDGQLAEGRNEQAEIEDVKRPKEPEGTRYLVVDDTGGLLVAAMAERMGILYAPEEQEDELGTKLNGVASAATESKQSTGGAEGISTAAARTEVPTVSEAADATASALQESAQEPSTAAPSDANPRKPRHRHPRGSDFQIPYSLNNTITLVHPATQPNLAHLTYYGYDVTNPNHPPHPLVNHLLPLTWLQLVEPASDPVYTAEPPSVSDDVLASWKANRRGNYHRKRRRWARTRFVVDSARAGGFSGLVTASTMDPASVLRPLLPLLAGGAPVAVYSQSIEPLSQLADCFSIARRIAWNGEGRPAEAQGKSVRELEHWAGDEDFPVNPTLLLGVQIQTSRARQWQVLPGRTHPIMTARGAAEGYVLTGWKAVPAEGKIEARGKFRKRKIGEIL